MHFILKLQKSLYPAFKALTQLKEPYGFVLLTVSNVTVKPVVIFCGIVWNSGCTYILLLYSKCSSSVCM